MGKVQIEQTQNLGTSLLAVSELPVLGYLALSAHLTSSLSTCVMVGTWGPGMQS
jgi:hypothetical protein